MKKVKMIMFLAVLLMFTVSIVYAGDDLMEQAQTIFKPIPQKPPTLERNPLTPEKIELGKVLYFDPRLSSSAV